MFQQSPRLGRPRRSLIVVMVMTALLAFPAGLVLASHSFSDVPDSHPFHADIAAVKDSGVSPTGCGGGKFCPEDNVTRGQMAAFLNRIGALGPGKTPVANAKTSLSTDGYSLGCATDTVRSGGVCIEKTGRATTSYWGAIDECATLSGIFGSGWRYRLPLASELRGARDITGIDIDAGGEWLDALHVDDTDYYSMVMYDAGNVLQAGTLSNHMFRCVATPVSRDFTILLSEKDAPPTLKPGKVNQDGSPKN